MKVLKVEQLTVFKSNDRKMFFEVLGKFVLCLAGELKTKHMSWIPNANQNPTLLKLCTLKVIIRKFVNNWSIAAQTDQIQSIITVIGKPKPWYIYSKHCESYNTHNVHKRYLKSIKKNISTVVHYSWWKKKNDKIFEIR